MAQERFEITDEMINKATDYIPLINKIAIAKTFAQNCIQPVEISVQKIQSDETLTLPEMYEDDTMAKQINLMYILLTEYLLVKVNDDFSAEDYDKFAKSHPMNQLERFKSKDTNLKNKVFDLLYDVKVLKKLIDKEIFNLNSAHNDTLESFLAGITLLSNPENIQKIVTELQKVTAQVQDKQAEVKQKRTTAKKPSAEKKQ